MTLIDHHPARGHHFIHSELLHTRRKQDLTRNDNRSFFIVARTDLLTNLKSFNTGVEDRSLYTRVFILDMFSLKLLPLLL